MRTKCWITWTKSAWKTFFGMIWAKEADLILFSQISLLIWNMMFTNILSHLFLYISLSFNSPFLRFLVSMVWFFPGVCLRNAWWWCSSCGASGRSWAWIPQNCPLWVYCRRDCSTWATAWGKCRTYWSAYSHLLCPIQDCLKDTGWGYFSVIANVISVLSGLFTPVITSVSSDPLKSAQQRHISVYIWFKHASPVSACDQIEERVSGLMTT